VDDDRLAFVAKGTINIPTAGTYNFTAHGDDGFGLRIRGQNWSSVSGGGGIDPRDSQTIYYAGGTGDSNTTGSVTLPAGNYQLEYVGFEGGGGANQELTVSTPGGLASLVGTPAAVVHNAGVTSAGWTVTTSAPGGTGVGNIAAARADLANFPAGSASNVTSINYSDPDNNGGGGGILGDVAFPNDIAGADDNDFSLLSTAQIVIPIAGNYRFGFRGDDGGYLRIAGVSGWSIVENATGLAQITDVNGVANPLGDTLWTDAATGNSTTVGQIALAAGTYNIEGLFFEISGGGNFEIFSSEAITGVENGYQLLAIGGDLVTRSTAGVTLVPEPTSLAMMVLGGSFLLRRRRRHA
jgi:hypothetical protein